MNLKHIKKTITLQHDQSDCGVACLASIIRYYGGDISIEKLREKSGTTKQGTTLLGLYQGAQQCGFEAEGNEANMQSLIDHGEPLILHIITESKLQHYVVCYGYCNNQFIIGDPAKGIVFYSKDELENLWSSKRCLTLKPNGQFQQKEEISKRKRDWIKNLVKEDFEILGFSIVLGIIIAVLGMVMAVFSQRLIDEILPSKDFTKLMLCIVLVGILLLGRAGLSAIRQYLLIMQSKNFNNRIIGSFYGALLFLPKSFFDSRKIGELVARLNDTTRIQRVITQIAGNFIIDSLIVFISVSFLFFYSWQAGVIATLSMPFYFLLIYRFNRKIISAQKDTMVAYAQSESNYISSMNGIAEIKIFNKQDYFAGINKEIYGTLQDKVFKLGKINVILGLISGAASIIFLIAILLLTSIEVYHDKMKAGELMAIIGIAASLLPSIGNLALISIPVNEAKVAFNRMFEFTDIKPEQSGEDIKGLSINRINIQNLSFRFAGRKKLLECINIRLQKKELIALVGESGGGKTTLSNILQQFYYPENGQILINETIILSEIPAQSWRSKIAVVPQDIHIFNGTVLDNICLGNTKEEAGNILTFLANYGFDKYINSLPNSYLTLLGEEGINLSGGQKQIIALARALYKKPELLILDEATAAMDRETERFTINLLGILKIEMAVFYISHRLHVLREIADRIYVIENGSVQISGTHDELMKSSNFYSNYFQN
jgi:ATP-binding cassette, subfamily C, bacteriocin exporter